MGESRTAPIRILPSLSTMIGLSTGSNFGGALKLLTGLELLQAAVMITDMMKPIELSNLVIAYS